MNEDVRCVSLVLRFHGDASIAVRPENASDRGFVSTGSHFIRVIIGPIRCWDGPVEKVVQNRSGPFSLRSTYARNTISLVETLVSDRRDRTGSLENESSIPRGRPRTGSNRYRTAPVETEYKVSLGDQGVA